MSTMTEYEMHSLAVLNRIASALETIAMSNAKAPAFVKPFSEYATFDWSSIGATITATDRYGASEVDWGGYTWKRRSPTNNFGEAIFYTRPVGKKADGSNEYVRLITFKELTKAKPISREAEALVEQSSAAHKPATSPSPAPAQAPAGIEHLPAKKTDVPSYCHIHLLDMTDVTDQGVYFHPVTGGLCNGHEQVDTSQPNVCQHHVALMLEQSKTGVPFHRITNEAGDTLAYCDGATVKTNGSKK